MVSGQGATATVWTPDLLQTLAQGRQVTVFTNKGVGYSTDAEETETSSISGVQCVSDARKCSIASQLGISTAIHGSYMRQFR